MLVVFSSSNLNFFYQFLDLFLFPIWCQQPSGSYLRKAYPLTEIWPQIFLSPFCCTLQLLHCFLYVDFLSGGICYLLNWKPYCLSCTCGSQVLILPAPKLCVERLDIDSLQLLAPSFPSESFVIMLFGGNNLMYMLLLRH